MPTLARRTLSVACGAALALLTLVGLGVTGGRRSLTAANAPATTHRTTAAAPSQAPRLRPVSKDQFVVAVVLGATGTVGSDALAPYEVLPPHPGSPCTPSPQRLARPRHKVVRSRSPG